MQVLERSTEALSEVTLKIPVPDRVGTQAVELVAAGSRLRRLVVWDSEAENDMFPFARLKLSVPKDQGSSFGQLQLLWVYEGVGKLDSKHLNSLISFAQGIRIEPLECRELIRNFSKTRVHLNLLTNNQESTIEPLLCPNLKIFEGWILGGLSSFLDASQLQTLILEAVEDTDLAGFPTSVEEIWLRSKLSKFNLAEDWNLLLHQCPKLRILKLMASFVAEIDFTGILEMLQRRKQMVQDGKEIDGIKMVSLEKLILPINMLNDEQLERAAEVADEVVDVRDHPEFIKVEY